MEKFWEKQTADGYITVHQKGGKTLRCCAASGRGFLERDGYLFKDLNGDGTFVPYKDWRLSADLRANDLASRLPIETIAGLMLYSRHQTVTAHSARYARLFGENTYDGKPFDANTMQIWQLTDQQKQFLARDHVRHLLLSSVDSAELAARWCNEVQKFCEAQDFGIPANISTDPRHGIKADAEYNLGSGSDISHWPEGLGLAATFDPDLVYTFARTAAAEYRALGITTALSPQVDLGTEPRWRRVAGTFGIHPQMAADMARAYCDGMQTTEGSPDGWGSQSVNAMVKHWPGGGTGEGGRDAHYCYGKYAVYPGGYFEEHLKPFTEGAFRLRGKTGAASAVMPYYTISSGIDTYGEQVGNSYSRTIIQDLLRGKYGYDGVVCTDWLITADYGPRVSTFAGKCWGVETLTVAQRHYKALLAGVDQFGGNNEVAPVLEAYRMLCRTCGEQAARARFERSAVRLLRNIFAVGLFEDPYVDPVRSAQIVGCPAYTRLGFEAQRKSIVMVKNRHHVLPLAPGKKVYLPTKTIPAGKDWFGNPIPAKSVYPLNPEILKGYYQRVEDPDEADFAIVCITSPISDGYSEADLAAGGNGYLPITLQYRPYTATTARKTSLASGDPLEQGDRNYCGKTNTPENASDLDLILETRHRMGNKPVIVCGFDKKPGIVAEYEREVDGILIHFGVSDQALLDIISGAAEPQALLPIQIPADMQTVEEHPEDKPGGLRCYQDENGHIYDFGYGLNWKGIIRDARNQRYTF